MDVDKTLVIFSLILFLVLLIGQSGLFKIKDTPFENLQQAIEEKDFRICEKMNDEGFNFFFKDICFLEVSNLTNDTTHCNKIETDHLKYRCYSIEDYNCSQDFQDFQCAYFKGLYNETDCKNFNKTYLETSCYQGVVFRENNISICENQLKENYDICLSYIIRINGNLSLCNNLTNVTKKENCLNLDYGNLPNSICNNNTKCIDLMLDYHIKEKYLGLI